MESRQLNLRLPPDERDRLEALAFIRRTNASSLARQIVTEYVKRHETEAGFTDAMRALAAHDRADNDRGSVTPLRPGRKS